MMNSKRVAVVVGASSGIGKACALKLSENFSVLMVARREEK